MSQEWYYSIDGDRQGPVAAADLKKLADAGTLKEADLVWKDGMADWVAAKSIKGLFNGAAASPSKSGEQAKARPVDDDEEDRPRSRRRDDDEDDRPSRSRRRDEDDDERPSRSRRRDEDGDDEAPPSRSRDAVDWDDDRPRKKKKRRVPDDVGGKKMTAGLLGILIGWTGAHRFYLGDTGGGLIRLLVLNLVCAGGIVGLIEGIIYLTKSDEDFYQTYIVEQKGWF
ncbi:MAG TPA: GYF domain-containing protein [Gemmataceae bacterium]|nr:GYF domain-containing protein [Gemmataceae bacterium]